MRTLGRSSSLVAAVALSTCTAVHAQVTPAPPPADPSPPVVQTPPPTPPPAPKVVERASRQDIRSMELLLTQALQTGAQELAKQLKVVEPNSAFVTGTGRARGFILEGHGLFFDVDVPEMRQSVIWSAQMLQLQQQRQNLRQFLAETTPEDPRRKFVESQLRYVERQMGGPPGVNAQMARPGEVSAAVAPVADTLMVPGATTLQESNPPAADQQVPPLRDPNELYTDSVKTALIDVMLKFRLKVREDEWLTIAASDSDGPPPGALDETSRILISIKGGDLAAYHSGKLTRDDVLKRVEVREF